MRNCFRYFCGRTRSGRKDGTQNADSDPKSHFPIMGSLPAASIGVVELVMQETKSTDIQTPNQSQDGAYEAARQNPYSKYRLGSPPQGPRAQSVQSAEKQMKKEGFKKYLNQPDSDKTQVAIFLYGRGFCNDKTRNFRVKQIKEIINNKDSLERAIRLLEPSGDKDVTDDPEYRKLCGILDQYFQQDGTVGILPSKNEKLEYYFRRQQQQGNCFLVAPCVMMSYFRQLKGYEKNTTPVDLTKFIRRTFTDRQLYKYFVEDCGGDAADVLKTLLKPLMKSEYKRTKGRPSLSSFGPASVITENNVLEYYMRQHGPGLVTNFRTHENFVPPRVKKVEPGYFQYSGRIHSKGKFMPVRLDKSQKEEMTSRDLATEQTLNQYHNITKKSEQDDDTTDKKVSSHYRQNIAHNDEEGVSKTLWPVEKAEETTDRSSESQTNDGKKKKNKKEKEDEDTHSMLLIGTRRGRNQKLWLLLQNWWDEMEIVEVSSDYFENCGGSILFIDEDQFDEEKITNPNPNDWFDVNSSLVADTNNLDRCEQKDGCFNIPIRDRKETIDAMAADERS